MNKVFQKSFLFLLFAGMMILALSPEPAMAKGEKISQEKQKLLFYLSRIESKETGLYQSYTNSAHYIEDVFSSPVIFMKTLDGYLDNQAFTYDQALALIAIIHAGEQEKSRFLLTVFESNFNTEKNGRGGLLNSYLTSNFDYFIPADDGKRVLLCMGIDGDRIHVGPNVWMGLASLQYYARSGSPEFLPFALKIFSWVRSLNHYPMPDGTAGGVCMGTGWGTEWNRVFSTEHNIDYYAFLTNLIKIYKGSNSYLRNVFHSSGIEMQDLMEEEKNIRTWLLTVAFNHNRGTFNRGANQYDDPDTVEALDCTSWAIAALGPDRLEQLGINTLKLMSESEKKFQVNITMNGDDFTGFDFTDENSYIEKRKRAIIWFEGTGQMALVYRIMATHFKKKEQLDLTREFTDKYRFYIRELDRFMEKAPKDYGLPCTSHEVNEKELDFTFSDWWPIIRTEKGKYSISLSSTLWRYFAAIDFNPFHIEMPSKITEFATHPNLKEEETKEKIFEKDLPEHTSDSQAQNTAKENNSI